MMNHEFKLECECGCNTFYICHSLEGDTCEIRCADCDCVIGHFSRFGVDWVKREKKKYVVFAD